MGLLGGGAGRPNRLYLNEALQERNWGSWSLQPGDSFTKESAGGGGLHSPLLRDPASVREDLLEGYITDEAACADYGVTISENGEAVGRP
jgi:N-methylhydantoinase B